MSLLQRACRLSRCIGFNGIPKRRETHPPMDCSGTSGPREGDRTDCGTQGCQRKSSQQEYLEPQHGRQRAAVVLDVSESENIRRKYMGKTIAARPSGRQDFARYDAIVACADDSLDLDSLAVSERRFCRGCKSTQSSKQCIPPLLGRGAGCMRAKRMLFMLSSLGA